MSGIPEEALVQHRRERTDGGPLLTKTGRVQQIGGTLYLFIPTPLPDILGIEKGDELDVHIYEGSYTVTTHTGDNGGDRP